MWLDHKRAIIVTITEQGETVCEISSQVERQLSRDPDSRSQSSQIPPDDTRSRAYDSHLNLYYDEVIEVVLDAQAVMLMGPGEAKGQIRKRMKDKGYPGIIAAVQSVDKMTNPQIAARVRDFFLCWK